MAFWRLKPVLFQSATLPFFSLCIDSHTAKYVHSQGVSGVPLSTAEIQQLPYCYHQMLWQHLAYLAFKVS